MFDSSLRADEIGVAIYKQQQNNIQAQTLESFASVLEFGLLYFGFSLESTYLLFYIF